MAIVHMKVQDPVQFISLRRTTVIVLQGIMSVDVGNLMNSSSTRRLGMAENYVLDLRSYPLISFYVCNALGDI